MKTEDEVQLLPFSHEHINLLLRYSLSVLEADTRGELRPLRKMEDN